MAMCRSSFRRKTKFSLNFSSSYLSFCVRANQHFLLVSLQSSNEYKRISSFLFMRFRPLRNASPENYVSACDCYDDGAGDDDDDGAPDAASERPFPVDSDDRLGGPGYP